MCVGLQKEYLSPGPFLPSPSSSPRSSAPPPISCGMPVPGRGRGDLYSQDQDSPLAVPLPPGRRPLPSLVLSLGDESSPKLDALYGGRTRGRTSLMVVLLLWAVEPHREPHSEPCDGVLGRDAIPVRGRSNMVSLPGGRR